MIQQHIVKYILNENFMIHLEKNTQSPKEKEEEENPIKKYQWTERQHKLSEYIMKLNYDDIIDLFALCAYGEYKRKNEIYKEDSLPYFMELRKGYQSMYLTKDACKIGIVDMFKDSIYSIYLSLQTALSLYNHL